MEFQLTAIVNTIVVLHFLKKVIKPKVRYDFQLCSIILNLAISLVTLDLVDWILVLNLHEF